MARGCARLPAFGEAMIPLQQIRGSYPEAR
jgi:hypothetical protein